ncbi:MAG: ABC transporter ATP-binding protein [Alphaproteobacteria bacterium]
MTATPLLALEGVRKRYRIRSGSWVARKEADLWAVDGVSFAIAPGETVGIVGESGCGKTTTAKMALRLEQPTEGRILFDGADLATLDGPALRAYRGAVQAVFQDPWSSLNPRMRVGDIIAEPLRVNTGMSRSELAERVAGLLVQVGLQPWQARLYPHEFSGGQRQRITIARAISLSPRLVVLDEPVSALDVSVQAQIMNLLRDLQDRLGLGFLLIAHSLGTVRYLCHRVVVMYLGQVVETADAAALFQRPAHPYSQALIAAALPGRPGEGDDDFPAIEGEIPSPANPPSGCRFHTRCPHVMPVCRTTPPRASTVAAGHVVSCHLHG